MPDAPSPKVAPREKQLPMGGVVISKTGIPQKAVPGTMAPHHGPTVPAVYKVPPGYPKEPTLVPKAETQPPPNVKAKAAAQAPPAAQAAVPKAGPPPVNQCVCVWEAQQSPGATSCPLRPGRRRDRHAAQRERRHSEARGGRQQCQGRRVRGGAHTKTRDPLPRWHPR